MDKKGFTLVELLAVITIISIILAIVFPEVTGVIKRANKTVKDIQINRILDSAYDYTLKNTNILPNKNEVKYITLNELKKEALIDGDIKDSVTNENFSDDLVIGIRNTKNRNNDTKYSKLHGDYLYTVEFEFMNSNTYDKNRPTIEFEGYNTNLVVMNLNIGSTYTPIKYSATSIDGIDLTNEVVENIIYNSKNVKKIDTSKPGIYYVNYSVVDENGYSNLSTVNVIVSDNTKPSLIIPSNQTINTDVTSFDLLEGVSCSDNSGYCDIEINGTINFGTSGKYIIEYIASDSFGNTTSLKRVITIE